MDLLDSSISLNDAAEAAKHSVGKLSRLSQLLRGPGCVGQGSQPRREDCLTPGPQAAIL